MRAILAEGDGAKGMFWVMSSAKWEESIHRDFKSRLHDIFANYKVSRVQTLLVLLRIRVRKCQ